MIRSGILYSTTLHVAVIAVGWLGLPAIRKPPPVSDIPIVVEIVTIAAKTNVPPPKAKPKAKPKPQPKPEAKKPPPPKKEAKPPPPPPPEEVAALPKPKPKPAVKKKPPPKPKPVAKPKLKPAPKVPQRLAKVKPRRKPPPPDAFASVLRTVAKIRRLPPAEKKEKTPKKKKKKSKRELSFEEKIAKVRSRSGRRDSLAEKLTLSERDAIVNTIRRQIEPCWNIRAGSKDADKMVIEIKVSLNPNGEVRRANISNTARMLVDPFYRAAAETALRAVKNKRCQPFKLPPDKYQVWREMTLNFDPSQMF